MTDWGGLRRSAYTQTPPREREREEGLTTTQALDPPAETINNITYICTRSVVGEFSKISNKYKVAL